MVRSKKKQCQRETSRTRNASSHFLKDGRRVCKCLYGRRQDNGKCFGPRRDCLVAPAEDAELTQGGYPRCPPRSKKIKVTPPAKIVVSSHVKAASGGRSKPSKKASRSGKRLKWDEFTCGNHGKPRTRVICTGRDYLRYEKLSNGKYNLIGVCKRCKNPVDKVVNEDFIRREGIQDVVTNLCLPVMENQPSYNAVVRSVFTFPRMTQPVHNRSLSVIASRDHSDMTQPVTTVKQYKFTCKNHDGIKVDLENVCYESIKGSENVTLFGTCPDCTDQDKQHEREVDFSIVEKYDIPECEEEEETDIPEFTCNNFSLHPNKKIYRFIPDANDPTLCVVEYDDDNIHCNLQVQCPKCGENVETPSVSSVTEYHNIGRCDGNN